MAERGALKALDPNVKASKGRLGAPPTKIPRGGANVSKLAEVDGSAKEMEAKLHDVLDENDELRGQFGELEEYNRKLQVTCINMEEEAAEWKKSYESLQAEGTELFQTYERKCTMLKEVSKQLDDHKHKLAEKDARFKKLQSSKDSAEHERDELREKTKTHNEASGKHESRFLNLKDEHNQTLAKLDTLQQQLRDAMRATPRAADAPLPATQTNTAELDNMKKQLAEAGEREKKVRDELQSMQLHVQHLMAKQTDDGACTSPLFADDTVGALPSMTPRRIASQTPGRGAPPKTPSGAMMEMSNMSPESLRERAESLIISNDLLRQELNASKRDSADNEETVANLESAVSELKSHVDDYKKKVRLATEQHVEAEEEREAALAEARELISRVHQLEEQGHSAGLAIVQELEGAKAQLAAAELKHTKAHSDLAASKKQIETQTAAAKNAENDMRLMYKRHKKEMTELQDKYKSGELEERYRVATHKAMQMEALVHKWVGYAREMGEVRALQEKRAAAIESNTADVQGLLQDALHMKQQAETKVSKWRRQCQRMQKVVFPFTFSHTILLLTSVYLHAHA